MNGALWLAAATISCLPRTAEAETARAWLCATCEPVSCPKMVPGAIVHSAERPCGGVHAFRERLTLAR